jgi:hypothetical protein
MRGRLLRRAIEFQGISDSGRAALRNCGLIAQNTPDDNLLDRTV